MKIEGDFTFDAAPSAVWPALLDPHVLSKTLPGCEKLEEVGENEYKGTLNIRVGPVQGRFDGAVTLSDVRELDGYHLIVNGQGPTGFMKGEGDIRLEPSEEGSKTLLHYSVDAQIGGRIASVGQRLLDTTSRSITRQSLESLNRQIIARGSEGDEITETIEAPSATRMAAEVARDVARDVVVPRSGIGPFVLGALAVVVLIAVLWYVLA